MKTIICILFIFLGFEFSATSQPSIQWQYSYGGTLNDGVSSGNAQQDQIEPTSDGGFIFGGYSKSNDGDVTGHHGLSANSDCWVVKTDSLGNIEWQRSFGGTSDEILECIKPTTDGGYIFCASTSSSDGDITVFNGGLSDGWVVKLDSLGNIEWQRTIGGSSGEKARSICQTYDGGFLLAGQTSSNDSDLTGNHGSADIFMVKFDYSGVVVWQKCIGGTGSEGAYSVRQTTDHGFILAGDGGSTDGDFVGNVVSPLGSAMIIKTDSLGNVEWFKSYGGNSLEWCRIGYQTSDGGYILGASSASSDLPGYHGSLDYLLIKCDSIGNLEWQHCYGGSDGETFKSARPTSDGGNILIGSTFSTDGDVSNLYGVSDCWVVKTDSLGNIEWEHSYGGSEAEDGTGIVETTDGGFIFVGESSSNDFDVSGHHGATTESDIWVVKLSSVPTSVSDPVSNLYSLSVFPGPVSSVANLSFNLNLPALVSIVVYDVQGKLVTSLADQNFSQGKHTLIWNAGDDEKISNGLYFIKFNIGDITRSVRVVISK